MSLFNADEIFAVGVRIEKNGREFYSAAAAMTKEPEVKQLLEKLADWESRHVKLFEEMREALPAGAKIENILDPDNEIQMYLKAAADEHVFLKNSDMRKVIGSRSTAREILDLAVGFEKDSVVFYASMKMAVGPEMGRDRLDALINEELNHRAYLNRELHRLGTK